MLLLFCYVIIGQKLHNSRKFHPEMEKIFEEPVTADELGYICTAKNYSTGKTVSKMVTMMALLIALAIGVCYMRHRHRHILQKQPGKIVLSETLHLGQKHYLAIVECEGNRYFLSITPHGVTCLDRICPKKYEKRSAKNTFIGDRMC
jgi:flagellar biogenesis protein FliO